MTFPVPSTRLHAAVGILSVALIAYQLVLMQILSLVQWYHFAYMVISVALLGFGASGTVLALAGDGFLRQAERWLPTLMILSGATMAVAVIVAQIPGGGFDSYLLFVDPSQKWLLLFAYVVFFVPFFLGALPLGAIFVRRADAIGSLYFANLLGSGLGGVLVVLLSYVFLPQALPGVVALLPLIAGLMVVRREWKSLLLVLSGVLLCVWVIASPPSLRQSEYKSMSRTMNIPDAAVVLERPGPFGLVQVVSSPSLRYGPGLSLTYVDEIPARQIVFNNGDWFGALPSRSRADTAHILDYTTLNLPYVLGRREDVLVLNARAGMEAAHALKQGARRLTAVEPHTVVAEILNTDLAATVDSLLQSVRWESVAPRMFLARDTGKYDLIVLPIVDAFGGTAGLYALQEQYDLTKEALHGMWNRLKDDGVLSLSSWMDYPVRNPLKLLATACEVLEEAGVDDPRKHIAAVRSWGTITFALKRSPLTEDDLRRVRVFCNEMLFDPALLPEIEDGERARFNAMQDDKFFFYLDEIASPHREGLYGRYDFQLQPATDERPYFSQFIRWQSVPHLRTLFGDQLFPFLEMGYLLVFATLVQIAIAAFILIGLPLIVGRREKEGRTWTVVYFAGIGLGYMFVEIVFIQRFVLYFGHPVFAVAAALGGMMLSSGVGSFISSSMQATRHSLMKVSAAIVAAILLYILFLDQLLAGTVGSPAPVRIVVAFLLIGSIGLMMGMAFPLGMRFCSVRHAHVLPLAWGVNGCASVLSAALATIVAVEAGFVGVLGIAAAAYAFSFAGTLATR